MSRATTLLSAAIKQVTHAREAILGVPGYDVVYAELAWDLDNIATRLEVQHESARQADERAGGEQLELGE